MDWTRFVVVLFIGEMLVLLQALSSVADGYFSSAQIKTIGRWMSYRFHATNMPFVYSYPQKSCGYTFLQHGGMWADVFIVSPLVAYLVGMYQFSYISIIPSAKILIIAFGVWILLAIFVFAPAGKEMPEAHAHGGHVTAAGWIHVAYATMATWIVAMVYIPEFSTPPVSKRDIITVSFALIPWVYLSVIKFNKEWRFTEAIRWQIASEILGIALLAYLRLG